jgi:hypothetical protein
MRGDEFREFSIRRFAALCGSITPSSILHAFFEKKRPKRYYGQF